MNPARDATYVSPKATREAGRPAMGQTADPAVAAAGSAMEARSAVATETFRGEHYLKVDSKGRVMLPAPFRHVFDLVDKPSAGAGFQMLLIYGGSDRPFVEGYTQAG
eukprot:gene54960-73420_t